VASRSAGLFAHCVYPMVLSNPFTLTENRPRPFSSSVPRRPAPKGERKGCWEGKRGGDDHARWSLTVIGTPCNGPFKWPLSANSTSSLRASSLASSKNTRVFGARPRKQGSDDGLLAHKLTRKGRTYLQ
jgi:hypothetical protein